MSTIDVDLEDVVSTDEAATHLVCCVPPLRFLCGAPFHEEAAVDLDAPGEMSCAQCAKLATSSACVVTTSSGRLAVHVHCPLDPAGRVCPEGPIEL